MGRTRPAPVDTILTSAVVNVNEKRDDTINKLSTFSETTSKWLQASIESYKHKIQVGGVIADPQDGNAAKKIKLDPSTVVPAPKPQEPQQQQQPSTLNVMNLKVLDLRKELKARGLDSTGLKKALQERLLNAIEQEAKPADNTENSNDKIMKAEYPSSKSPFAPAKDVDEPIASPSDRMSFVPTHDEPKQEAMDIDEIQPPVQPEEPPVVLKQATKKPEAVSSPVRPRNAVALKNASALFSTEKITSKFQEPRPMDQDKVLPKSAMKKLSPVKILTSSIVKTANNLLKASPIKQKMISAQQPKIEADAAAKPHSTSASNGDVDRPVEAMQTDSESVDMMSATIKSDFSAHTSNMAQKLKARTKELTEARKQRLAEMRGKSKPIGTSASKSTKLIPSSSSTAGKPPDNKRTMMNAKIREKHAALKGNQPAPTVFSSKPSTLSSAVAKNANGSSRPVFRQLGKGTTENLVPSSAPGSSKHQFQKKQAPPPVGPQQQVDAQKEERRKTETYEISDREEESDSDEESDAVSVQRPKKPIPQWAKRSNLLVALQKQFADNKFDPDGMFTEVETCDLEAIFGKNPKGKYKKRTSSGNWTKDRVTVAEKLTYKRDMGYGS